MCGEAVDYTVFLHALEKDVYSTTLLPGFELPLAKLLAAADKWGAD
jgi:hypothetical protein